MITLNVEQSNWGYCDRFHNLAYVLPNDLFMSDMSKTSCTTVLLDGNEIDNLPLSEPSVACLGSSCPFTLEESIIVDPLFPIINTSPARKMKVSMCAGVA
ncbi:MAG: hypothetical protein R8M45_03560, partial [Ghiorsea sp.]